MADPAIIECPADVWTKVANAVTTGVVHITDNKPNVYLQTYRVAAQPAPTDNDDAIPFDGPLQISNLTVIDVYVQPTKVAGEVRVDL